MKNNILLTTLCLGFLVFLFNSNSGGAGAVQDRDRTGSPLALGTCANCHGGGNFNSSVNVEILDGETAVTAYEPNRQYTFRVTVTASNNPAGYGFQAVVLNGDDANAGVFGAAPAGTAVTTLNNRQYFEHNARSTTNTWSIDWTAPAAGTGGVRIYAAGNAVNGSSGESGDSPTHLETPITIMESVTNQSSLVQNLNLEMEIFPNPVQDVLNIALNGAESGRFQLRLMNAAGQVIQSNPIDVYAGRAKRQINVQNLPAGHYTLMISDGKRAQSLPLIKR